MSQTEAAQAATHDDKQTYDVVVFSPRNPADKRPFTWDKHLPVGEAAAQAAAAFGYGGGHPTLAKDGKPLDRNKQLVAEHVRDGDVLELVDAGGGV